MARPEAPNGAAETRLNAAIRLSEVARKHFPIPEGKSDISIFIGAKYEPKVKPTHRRWELNVNSDGSFIIRDILPADGFNAGGFTHEYTVDPTKSGEKTLMHKNEERPKPEEDATPEEDIAETEAALKKFLPKES